jgi:hypothetical protein
MVLANLSVCDAQANALWRVEIAVCGALPWYAAELEKCQLGGPYQIGRGVNPNLWAAICCNWPVRAPDWILIKKIITKEQPSGWRDMQIDAQRVHLVLSFLTQGDKNYFEHVLW